MRFRPCIDIHNGKVKQIVGSTLTDAGDTAKENYVAEKDAAGYAALYRKENLPGGHVILLNSVSSPFYEADKKEALSALSAYPGGLMAGGGMTPDNAGEFLSAGASHVIVTSYVFSGGEISHERLIKLVKAVGREHLVLDVSCRKGADGRYYVVTDRWQKMTKTVFDEALLDSLSGFCDEFLVHAVDAEGKQQGIEPAVAKILGNFSGCPVTYAGGIARYEDLSLLKEAGSNRVDVTVGSALSLFGGPLSLQKILEICDS